MTGNKKPQGVGEPQAVSKSFSDRNYTRPEVIEKFSAAMVDAGVIVKDPITADGILHRCHVEGDKRGTKNGAYILHMDGKPSGWFQHFTGATGKWTLSGKREPMSFAMRAQIEADRRQRQEEQQQRHAEAANKAAFIWNQAKPITTQSEHSYLVAKRIQPHNARLFRNALAIPIYSQSRRLVNLQLIQSDGTKRFLSGGQKKHCFGVIGKPAAGRPILICEGWATGASLNEATGNFVVVALDAGNLEAVALVMRCLYPGGRIIVAGDNDESGTGQRAARAAALAVGGKYLLPATLGHDWNDALTREVV